MSRVEVRLGCYPNDQQNRPSAGHERQISLKKIGTRHTRLSSVARYRQRRSRKRRCFVLTVSAIVLPCIRRVDKDEMSLSTEVVEYFEKAVVPQNKNASFLCVRAFLWGSRTKGWNAVFPMSLRMFSLRLLILFNGLLRFHLNILTANQLLSWCNSFVSLGHCLGPLDE